jgi:hypothetical protein
MKKIVFFFFLLSICLNANILHDKIENLLGNKSYETHQKLIDHLFKDETKFVQDEKLNYIEILSTLKQNGLLDLRYEKPQEVFIQMVMSDNPMKSLKIFNDTLKSLGYYYYFTKQINKNDGSNLVWTIKLNLEYAIDPLIFLEELKRSEIYAKDITLENNSFWKYSFDTKNGKILQAIKIDTNEKIVFDKPLDSYFLKIDEADVLKVISRKLNRWYPYIVFYDNNFEVLKTIDKSRVFKGIQSKIPETTKYIKIGDKYNLINIKRGLSVIVQNN